jgi:hypothetical protein
MTQTTQPAMQGYKVLEGTHYARTRPYDPADPKSIGKSLTAHTLYHKGDVVYSDEPLDQKYACKFEKVIPGVNAPVVVTDARRYEVTMLIQQGRWSEDDRKFLEELTDENFSRVNKHAVGQSNTPPERKKTILGDDVTDTFQRAYDEGFRVYRNASGKHQVTRPPNINKPLNKEALEADKVDLFVGTWLKENK